MSNIHILGIESSCDDTCVAIIDSAYNILSNIIVSQHNKHLVFGGVVPEIAARAHIQNLEYVMMQALKESNLKIDNIDVIAATSGPGLIGGVLVGSMFGKSLASALKKPFIAVNHLEGHALTAKLTDKIDYPYLLLLLSGGHCQFVSINALGNYKILGGTIDDAVGEAFDKVGKMLGLSFPGGPEIEKLAKLGNNYKYTLPKPIIAQDNCNMSFSGLKTAVKILVSKLDMSDAQVINDIAASFQYTVGEVLRLKLIKAIESYSKLHDNNVVVVAGGVAANQYIINILRQQAVDLGYKLIAPPVKLCTDNAAMIAFVGLERFTRGVVSSNDFSPVARWSLEDLSI